MKYTIEGFSQEYAMTLRKQIEQNGQLKTIKIDCIDLIILRWFVDFYPSMKKMLIDGKEYVWLSHKYMSESIPLLDISKRACIERMHKLVDFDILDYVLLKENGTFSLYSFGKNYIKLIAATNVEGIQNNTGGIRSNVGGGIRSNVGGVYVQTCTKDSSNIDSSIREILKKENKKEKEISEIVSYLNEKAGKHFSSSSKNTIAHISARLSEGYTVDDFKRVIDIKCAKWKNDTKMCDYLRPDTLFGSKFESYINESMPNHTTTKSDSCDTDNPFLRKLNELKEGLQ